MLCEIRMQRATHAGPHTPRLSSRSSSPAFTPAARSRPRALASRRRLPSPNPSSRNPPNFPTSAQIKAASSSPSVLRTPHNIKTRIARCSKTSGSPSTATTAAATTTFTPANVITNPPAATSSARVTSRSISRAPLPLPASPPTRTCKSPRAISPSIARAATPPLPRRCNFASRKALAMPTE